MSPRAEAVLARAERLAWPPAGVMGRAVVGETQWRHVVARALPAEIEDLERQLGQYRTPEAPPQAEQPDAGESSEENTPSAADDYQADEEAGT